MFGSGSNKKFFKAVSDLDVDAVRAQFKRGVNIEARDKDGLTPLMLAARRNAGDIAKFLLDQGANVHQVSNFGDTALHWAAKNNGAAIAAHLIERLADINHPNNKNFTPLMICAIYGSLEVGRLLLEKGARTDIISEGDNKRDALQTAYANNQLPFAQLLSVHLTGDKPQWELTGEQSVSRRSRLDAETAITEHFDFAAKMYTSIVTGATGTPSHTRGSFNAVAKPLLAEARTMLRALSLKGP